MLPMITKNEDANYLVDNENLAKAIVAWRAASTMVHLYRYTIEF